MRRGVMKIIKQINSKKRAEECAKKVREYWSLNGYDIEAHVIRNDLVETQDDGHQVVTVYYSIKTDLINGLPKDYKGWLSE